jgi:hypothetical protein
LCLRFLIAFSVLNAIGSAFFLVFIIYAAEENRKELVDFFLAGAPIDAYMWVVLMFFFNLFYIMILALICAAIGFVAIWRKRREPADDARWPFQPERRTVANEIGNISDSLAISTQSFLSITRSS